MLKHRLCSLLDSYTMWIIVASTSIYDSRNFLPLYIFQTQFGNAKFSYTYYNSLKLMNTPSNPTHIFPSASNTQTSEPNVPGMMLAWLIKFELVSLYISNKKI